MMNEWSRAARLALAALFFCTISVGAAPAQVRGTEEQEAAEEEGEALFLEGVIVAASPADSVALVRPSAARARVLRIGQEIRGYLLVEVTKSSARLRGREGDLQLFLSGERVSITPTSTAAPALEEEGRERQADDGWIRRAIPRASAKERLSKEIPVILKETDVAPQVEEGEVTGLTVSRLPDGTILSEAGLLPGDVLVSINGEPLRGMDSLRALLSRLLDRDEIRVVVRRKGEVLKLAYDFTN